MQNRTDIADVGATALAFHSATLNSPLIRILNG